MGFPSVFFFLMSFKTLFKKAFNSLCNPGTGREQSPAGVREAAVSPGFPVIVPCLV